MALWDGPHVELKCQSVRSITFFASNSLHNHGGQKYLCACHNPKNFKQIHWNQLFCVMYSLTVMLSISTRTIASKNIDDITKNLYWLGGFSYNKTTKWLSPIHAHSFLLTQFLLGSIQVKMMDWAWVRLNLHFVK